MQKYLRKLPAFAFAAMMAFPAAAQDAPTADTIVATVNGTDIKLGHMIVARATLPEQYQQLPDEVLYTGILDQLIQQTALLQSLTIEPPKRVALSLENERRSLLAAEAVEIVLQEALTEDAIQEVYDTQFSQLDGGEEYNASHILVETEAEAAEIKAALDDGGDFAETAKEKSTGPSGPSGGSLGWFGPGMMVPAFEAAVVEMQVGDLSDPVQTEFGWHIVKLNDKRTKPAPTLEEARAEIEQQIQRDAVEEKVAAVTDAADVDRSAGDALDPALIKNMDLIGN